MEIGNIGWKSPYDPEVGDASWRSLTIGLCMLTAFVAFVVVSMGGLNNGI